MLHATVGDLLSWKPCQYWTPNRIRSIAQDKETWTALEVIACENVPPADRLWIVLRPDLIPRESLQKLPCRFAEHVLPLFERIYPKDNRPRNAIATARLWIDNKTEAEAAEAARSAAWEAWAAEAEAGEAAMARSAARARAWWARAAARAAEAEATAWGATWMARSAAWAAVAEAAGTSAWATWAAARAAARAAAWGARAAGAGEAGEAAERQWQIACVKSYLTRLPKKGITDTKSI